MQPNISRLDRFFISYIAGFFWQILAWTLAITSLALIQSWFLCWLLALPLFIYLYGAWVVHCLHPMLTEQLKESMSKKGKKLCELSKDDETFSLAQSSGSINHFLLRSLADHMELTLLAPQKKYAYLVKLSGTIFRPRWLNPLKFWYTVESQMEIYYADVNYIEYENDMLSLHFSNGKTYTIAASEDGATAVATLRAKLREHKAA